MAAEKYIDVDQLGRDWRDMQLVGLENVTKMQYGVRDEIVTAIKDARNDLGGKVEALKQGMVPADVFGEKGREVALLELGISRLNEATEVLNRRNKSGAPDGNSLVSGFDYENKLYKQHIRAGQSFDGSLKDDWVSERIHAPSMASFDLISHEGSAFDVERSARLKGIVADVINGKDGRSCDVKQLALGEISMRKEEHASFARQKMVAMLDQSPHDIAVKLYHVGVKIRELSAARPLWEKVANFVGLKVEPSEQTLKLMVEQQNQRTLRVELDNKNAASTEPVIKTVPTQVAPELSHWKTELERIQKNERRPLSGAEFTKAVAAVETSSRGADEQKKQAREAAGLLAKAHGASTAELFRDPELRKACKDALTPAPQQQAVAKDVIAETERTNQATKQSAPRMR